MNTDPFITLLRDEFTRRKEVNHRYSLRSYARFLGIYHGTLSTLLSGKRKLSPAVRKKLAKKIDPDGVHDITLDLGASLPHIVLDAETSEKICHWHFDAILELSKIPGQQLTAKSAAKYLGIPFALAHSSLKLLVGCGLLQETPDGLRMTHERTTNLQSNEHTSQLMRDYQKEILKLSSRAVDTVDRKYRDHTSTTIAISAKDLPKIKEIIKKFRFDLASFLQRDKETDEVYQLQISFFPLRNIGGSEK